VQPLTALDVARACLVQQVFAQRDAVVRWRGRGGRRSVWPHPSRRSSTRVDEQDQRSNFSTHATPAIRAWLAGHKRLHYHSPPTSASLAQTDGDLARVLARQAIRPGQLREGRGADLVIEAFTPGA
jgi:hypothetical protein